jgi:hypothetical protein
MCLQEPFERPPPLDLIQTSLSECARAAKNASCKVRIVSPVAPVTDYRACPYWPTTSRGMFSWFQSISPT